MSFARWARIWLFLGAVLALLAIAPAGILALFAPEADALFALQVLLLVGPLALLCLGIGAILGLLAAFTR